MDLKLKDKVALVTGAGSQKGFGKGISLVLAKEGCDIVACDIDLAGAKKTAEDIKALGRKAIALEMDVTNNSQVNDKVKEALDKFGKIDILVNTAGGSTPPQPFAETTEAKWEKDINLNLRGTLNCTRAVLPHMISRRSGKIVNFSSIAGLGGQPTGAIYGAAKAGVIAFTQGLSKEVIESGINVNCIAPGLGATNFFHNMGPELIKLSKEMEEKGLSITPEDIGNAVAFLVSDVSRRFVGQCLAILGVT
jgi:NAD(P)-dependent dehydrogenase (short-subunit alcohol dehydrogenase family)